MDLARRRNELIAELEPFSDHHERFQYVIDRAKSAPALPAELKLEAFLIEGCTSNLWLVPSVEDGVCRFRCDADSPLVRGLLVLLCDFYSGATPAEVAATEPALIAPLGLDRNLSPTRLNGLRSVRARIRDFAAAQPA